MQVMELIYGGHSWGGCRPPPPRRSPLLQARVYVSPSSVSPHGAPSNSPQQGSVRERGKNESGLMNGRGQIDMWRFVRWVPNLSTTDYHSLMSTPVCVSMRFSLSTSPQNVLSPLQLCAGPEWPVDHRCAVNWETHTSVIKAVGGLVLYQLPPIPNSLKPALPL